MTQGAGSEERASVNSQANLNRFAVGALAVVLAWWIYDLQYQWRFIPEYQFGWFMIALAGYLVFDRWPTRPPPEDRREIVWPLALAAMGAPLILVAELYKHGIARTAAASFSLSVGCAFFISAILLYSQGRRTFRFFLFPLLFMFLAVPLPKMLWNPIVFGLQGMITALNVEALNLFGIPATQQGNVIQLPRCVVGVDEACSGIRSLQSSIMAALFIGNLTLKRTGSQIFLLAAGVGLAVVGNFLRSFYLSITAHEKGVDALKALHDTAGWSILLFTALGLIGLVWVVGKVEEIAADATARAPEPLDATAGD